MCKAKVFKIGAQGGESISSSKEFLQNSVKSKKNGIVSLSKVNMHLRKINDIIFSGQPEGDF